MQAFLLQQMYLSQIYLYRDTDVTTPVDVALAAFSLNENILHRLGVLVIT